MKTILETTYKVKKAHNQGLLLDCYSLKTVRNFLIKQQTPFNYDVDVFNWDGDEWSIITYTGDDFLEITNPNKVTQPQ